MNANDLRVRENAYTTIIYLENRKWIPALHSLSHALFATSLHLDNHSHFTAGSIPSDIQEMLSVESNIKCQSQLINNNRVHVRTYTITNEVTVYLVNVNLI